GKGSTFYLGVPLTLTTERGLIVKSAGQLFAMPTHGVVRVMLLKSEDIIHVERTQAILLDKHPVHLCRLSDILNLQGDSINVEQCCVVAIRKSQNSVAFIVDEIMGEREIVIKPLQAPVAKVPCITGATISGNGEIII